MDNNSLCKKNKETVYGVGEIMSYYEWDVDNMSIIIKAGLEVVMTISVYEVVESCKRKDIMRHVKECDRSPWLKNWGADDEIIDKLKGIR